MGFLSGFPKVGFVENYGPNINMNLENRDKLTNFTENLLKKALMRLKPIRDL